MAKDRKELHGVLDISDPVRKEKALKQLPVKEVWGIGPRLSRYLYRQGVKTAWDLKSLPLWWAKKRLSVLGVHIVLELRGIPCHNLELEPRTHKSMVCSRSFGTGITQFADLKEALSLYVHRAAGRLRDCGQVAGFMQVFLQTNRFKDIPQRNVQASKTFSSPTSFTPELLKSAHSLLERIFKPGFEYNKTGVLLADLVLKKQRQMTFGDLENKDRPEKERLMQIMDFINQKYGAETLQAGLAGKGKYIWDMRRKCLSKRYTTSWKELPEAR